VGFAPFASKPKRTTTTSSSIAASLFAFGNNFRIGLALVVCTQGNGRASAFMIGGPCLSVSLEHTLLNKPKMDSRFLLLQIFKNSMK
jgi:hypothetical protein